MLGKRDPELRAILVVFTTSKTGKNLKLIAGNVAFSAVYFSKHPVGQRQARGVIPVGENTSSPVNQIVGGDVRTDIRIADVSG
jgi:hypothetical protein